MEHISLAAARQSWRRQRLLRDLTLGETMSTAAADHPQAPIVFHSETRPAAATLADLHAQGRQVAGALSAIGARPGDVIAVQLPNWIENALLHQAAAALDCVLLPIVHILGATELTGILRDSGARFLVVPDRWRGIDFLERVAHLGGGLALETVLVVGEATGTQRMSWSALLDRAGPPPPVAGDPDRDAMLLYTSGTTAGPKGVRHSHNSLLAEFHAQAAEEQGAEHGWLSPWPAGHIAGTIGLLNHAVLGRPTVLMDAWDPEAAAALIATHRIRTTSGTPFHLASLLDAARSGGHALDSLSRYIIGATTVPPSVVARAEAAGIRACRCYGSTEHPTISLAGTDDPLEMRLNTDGRPMPGSATRIVDDEGRDLQVGAEGEIVSRGPELFAGYTDAALDAEAFLPGGWYRTGDIGRLDEEGCLTVTDRKKDIIIRGGENISSREVEDLLIQIPGVIEAAAVAAPDGRLGEAVCAFIVAEPGSGLSLESIGQAFQAMRVARQKTPERLVLTEVLPRTPTGKVRKADLRAMLRGTGPEKT